MYAGYRYPPQVISHAVWLYHRFTLSFRDTEDLLAARGINVSYETVRNWCINHSTEQYENNRCELSHQPTRQQERQMRQFKSQGHAQRFLSCHGVVNKLFRLGRHLMRAKNYRTLRERAFNEWTRVSCVQNLV